MRKNLITLITLWLMCGLNLAAEDPAISIDAARAHIAAKRFHDAVRVLEPALPAADSLAEKERSQALGAVHFYMAVAFSGMRDDRSARIHLKEFFRLSPNSSRIDPAKYDRRFVVLFTDLSPARAAAAQDVFETYYPPFGSGNVSKPQPALPEGAWGDSPALQILATSAEKREWQSLVSAADRAHFIAEFWRRRDPTPTTPQNEFRDTFDRRVAFADSVFGTSEERGSMSDRGKVFELLGEPSFVRRRPISRGDTTGHNRVWVPPDTMINGTIEQWVYTREQVPIQLAKPDVTYRFVTQPGIGVAVLQKENAYAMQALDAAANPNAPR